MPSLFFCSPEILPDYVTPAVEELNFCKPHFGARGHMYLIAPPKLRLCYRLRSRWANKTTLYSIPFGILIFLVRQITNNWGKLKAFSSGRHKKYSFLKNPYLYLRFTNLQIDYIPETIKINDIYITVILPGENINSCGFCKSKNHSIEQGVVKPGNKI